MGTGLTGTFVISWAQTELDGHWGAPLSSLAVGSAWSWTGDCVRVDGAPGVLPLGDAEGMADIRRRAAQGVRRLVGAAMTRAKSLDDVEIEAPGYEAGFTVTDGRSSWLVTLIDTSDTKTPLAMFMGDVPPRHMDLWIVSHNVDTDKSHFASDLPGGVICFTPGTTILTENGPQLVETITEGTRLQTKDNGCEEVLWVGARRISGARLYAMPHLAPIRLREGALDRGVPDAGLLVSPDHRLILRGPRAQALFNTDEVLVSARDLINDTNIHVDRSVREVVYIHLMLPQHQILIANGVESESFHPASAALSGIEEGQLSNMFSRLPELRSDPSAYGDYARRVLSKSEAAILNHDAA